MQTVHLWRWVVQEPSSPLQMVPLGITGLLEQREFSGKSPTGTVPSWQWVTLEPLSPLPMELLGIIGLLGHQKISKD